MTDANELHSVPPTKYTEYELSDEHMRGLIGDTNTHPVLRKVRKEHFDAWLEAHDRRVKADAWDEGFTLATRNNPNHPHPMARLNPYRTETQ